MLRTILLGSLLLNLGLAVLLIANRGDRSAGQEVGTAESLPLLQALRILDAAAVPPEGIRAVTAAYACQKESAGTAEYWKPAYVRDAERERGTYALLEAARESLAQRAGEADANPVIASLFAPYAHQYPFVPADKQVALQRIRAEHHSRLLADAAWGPQAASTVSKSLARMQSDIRTLLTADEYFEYSLRESPLGQQLIATGFDFSEEEFRKVFAAYSVDNASLYVTAAPTGSAQGERLKAALGEARYFELERSRDPAYRLLWSHAERHGLTSEMINDAYATIYRSKQELAALGARAAVGGAGAQTAAVYEARDRALRAALGDAAQREISRQLAAVAPRSVNRVVVQAR